MSKTRLSHRFQFVGRYSSLFVVLAVFTLSVQSYGFTYAEETLSFRFDPPDNTVFVETLRLTKTIDMGSGELQTEESESQTEYRLQRTKAGASITTRPIVPKDIRPSGDILGSVNSLVSNLRITYNHDSEGRLLGIHGANEAIDQVLEKLGIPEELLTEMLAAAVGRDVSLEDLILGEYLRREFFVLSGATLPTNREFSLTGPIPAPLGLVIEGEALFQVTPAAGCGGRECARVEAQAVVHNDAIGQHLTDALRAMLIKVAEIFAPDENVEGMIPVFSASDSSLEISQTRLISPETCLPYGEHSTMVLATMVLVEGDPIPATFTYSETREYSYDYR